MLTTFTRVAGPAYGAIVLWLLSCTLGGCCAHLMPSFLRGPPTPSPAAPAPGEPMVLEEIWRVEQPPESQFQGLATDPTTGHIYANLTWERGSDGWTAIVKRFDRGGGALTDLRLGPLPEAPNLDRAGSEATFRLANLDGDSDRELLQLGRFGVSAFESDGTPLWEHSLIDRSHARRFRDPHELLRDARAADLDADGIDEVLVAYAASDPGLFALNADGTTRWKRPDSGWRGVAAGPTGPNGDVQVMLPWRGIRVLSGEGQLVSDVDLKLPDLRGREWLSVDFVEAAPATGGAPSVVVAGYYDGHTMACLNTSGDVHWSRAFEGNRIGGGLIDAACATDRPWIALAKWKCRRVLVHDVTTGDRLASIQTQGWPRVAWLPADGAQPPLLIVGTYWSVSAYRMGESQAPLNSDAPAQSPGTQ